MLMTVPPSPSRHREAEMTCFDIKQELNFQLEESQQQLRDVEANFRITKATLYVLAAELRKFKSTTYKDVIDSVLGERLQPKEQELAEKLSLTEQLRESCILIGEQRRKLSQLRQKLQEGSNESLLLKEHLKAVLTRHDADPTRARDLRGQLAEGCRLAEILAGKLKPENLEEESGKDCQSLLPRVSTGGVEKQGGQVPRDWQDEAQEQPSGRGDPSDRQQPPCSAALPVDEISPSPDAAEPQDTLSQQEEEEEAVVTWYLEDGDNISDSLTYTLDKHYLMVSTCQDSPASPKPSNSPVFLANQSPCGDEDAPEPEAPRQPTIEDQRRPLFLGTWCVTIQDNSRKLTQLREQLRKGKEAAFSLGQCLQRLFTQEEPAHEVQRHREELMEACKLADHLVLQLHTANCGGRTGEEEKEPLYQEDDESSDLNFLIQAQARELTQLRKKLEAGRNVASILQKNLKDLVTDNDFDESQGQSLLQLAEWRGLAERLTLQLGSEHHCDTEDEEETESLDSSDEHQDEKVDEVLSDSVAERSLLGTGRPDPPYQQQHCISVAVPAEEREASSVPDGTKPEGILKPQEEQAPELSSSSMELGNQTLTHIGKTFCNWKDIIIFLRHRIRDLLSQDGPGSREGQSPRDHAEGHKLAEPLALQPCPESTTYKDVVDFVLGERLQPKEQEPAEKLSLAEQLRESCILIGEQRRKLSQLRQKLQEGSNESLLLKEPLKAVLTRHDADPTLGRDLRGQPAEGCRLAEILAGKPENLEEESGKDCQSLLPRVSTGGVEKQAGQVPRDWQDEAQEQPSGRGDPSDRQQPPCSAALPVDEISPSPDAAEPQDTLSQEEEEEQAVVTWYPEDGENINDSLTYTLDRNYLMVSTCQDSPASPKPSKTPVFLANQSPCEDEDAPEPEAPRQPTIEDQRRPLFLGTWCVTIQDNTRKLTQLREQLRKGKEAAFSLGQCLQRLFTQEEPAHEVQRHREELVEACKLADHLVLQLHTANCGGRTGEEEKEPLYHEDDESSDLNFLIQAQARELTQLRKKLEAGRNVASILQKNLKDLVMDNDFDESQGQSLLQLAEWRGLAERLTLQLGSEHHCDTEDEEETESLDSSDEHQDEKVDEVLSDSVAERSLLGTGRPDPPYQQQHCISVAVPAEEREASSVPDGTKPEGILKPQEEQAPELSSSSMELGNQTLTHIGKTFCNWKDIIIFLRHRIRDLLSRDGPGSREGQSPRDHAEGHKLAEPLALQPCPESTTYKDVVDFVLGERLQPKEQEPAEKLSLAEQLRESCILIGEQRRKLSQLRQKLQEGSNESLLLKEPLKAVLTRHDADPTLGRDLRGQPAEGCRLAEILAGKPENLEEESGKDCQSLLPRVSTGGVEKQAGQVPRDWQDEAQEQPSGRGDPSDRQQPPCSAALPVDEISPSPDAAEPQDTLSQEEEEEEAVVTWYPEDGENINDSLTYTLDRNYLMVSTCQDSPASPKPSKTPVFLANQSPCEDEDAPEPEAPRQPTIEDQRRPLFLGTWCVTIQDNTRKLTQLREQLRKGKEAAFSLGQCLQRLFTQEEPAHEVQRHREELVEACKLADHLVLQLHTANCGGRTGEEEKEPLYQEDDESSDLNFLIQAQARELTQLRKKLEAGRNVASILQKNLKDLVTDNDFDESQGQSLLQLAEWRGLAERLTLQLGSEHHCDTEDEEETESLDSSDEHQDEKVDEVLSDSVAERSLLGTGRPDPPYQQQHCISVAVPAEEREASSVPDGTKPEGILKPQEEQAPELSSSSMELGNQTLTHIGKTFCNWKDIIIFLRHRIRDLLSRDGPGSREGQSPRDHAEGHKLAEPLALQPCPESTTYKDVVDFVLGERLQPKEQEPAEKLSLAEQLRESCILIGEQRRKLSQLRQKLQEGSNESLLLKEPLKAVLTRHDADPTLGRDLRGQPAEGCRLAEILAGKPEPQDTLSQEEEEEEAVVTWYPEDGDNINDSLTYTLDKNYLMVSTCQDSPASPKPSTSPVFLALPQVTCPQGLPSPTFEVPKDSLLCKDHCVGTQPDQYLDRGAGRATLSLSSAPWRFVGHTDAGQQWLHSTELNLDASLGLENPPKAEGDALGGSGDTTHEIRAHGHPDATAVLRQRMMERKPRFRQWKMACRFPGAQA